MRKPRGIWGVFLERCGLLCSSSDGAALAITLAFMLPASILFVGVYGVGELVRNKIELQNAADAAAYSAAVVQADYLSRMATVNKAMAWTYVDLQKRSLDAAMDMFSAYVIKQFNDDLNMCKQRNTPCHMHDPGVNYNCGTDVLVDSTALKILGTGLGVPFLAKEFNGQGTGARFLLSQLIHVTTANIKGKGFAANIPKIYKYSYNIINMSKKLVDLHSEYPKKIKETARQVAVANMVECEDDYFVNVTCGNENLSFFFMTGSDDNEKAFISFADPTLEDFSPKSVFGPGTDDWIVRKGALGFWRVYKQTKTHLFASWDWFWTRWVHVQFFDVPLHLPPITPGGATGRGHPKYHGYDSMFKVIKNDLPIGLLVTPAVPITLTPEFFGKSGSITVAIARKSPNPLSAFTPQGRSMSAPGILSAFDVSAAGGSRPEYMCAIASARAGYKQYNSDKQKKLESSEYTLGYVIADKEKTWNLIETDWDAMFLPVRHAWDLCAGTSLAQTFAPDPLAGGNILKTIMLDKDNWTDKDGKKVDKKNLPDWENLSPPGGLVKDDKSKDNKLDWAKLSSYLGH